ncbi:MAG: MBL fold metallo-hydrolase [Vallitaleaceae bacterium]|nr:MBL fold metallo-hydrolase [Vallitaleaceae bacterium]
MTLKHIVGNSYMIPGAVNIGVFARDHQATIIDSGNDLEAGRKIKQLLVANELELVSIINTHSNADHIGGNAFLQKHYNCDIIATEIESTVINHTLFEPMYLYGAHPFKSLRNKYVQAESSRVTSMIKPGDTITGHGQTFKTMDLSGHFWSCIGIHTEDDVVYLGDSLFSETIIEKYGFFFMYHVQQFLDSLDVLEKYEAAYYVPSHADLSTDITDLVVLNRKRVHENIEMIYDFLDEPKGIDRLFFDVAKKLRINGNPTQYMILTSTIKAYISHLVETQKIELTFKNGFGQFYRL